jgi:RecA-family ATPase
MKYTPRLHVDTIETRLPEAVHAYLQHGAAQGQRNATLYSMAQQFFAAGIPQAEAQNKLLPRALADGLREAESITAIMSGYKSTVVTDPIKSRRTVSHSVASAMVHKDDFIQALQAAFLPDELVAVCDARWQEDRWVPDAAMIKTRTQWEKHHAKRPIDLVCSTGGGAYIGINPLSTLQGGRKNDNIHAYRHVLAEFDDGDPEEQRRTLETSGLPITLIVTSGKRSIHGWIRVDAANKQEWDERRDQIFTQLKCDPKNNDPARVSRCPGVLREVDGVRVLQALLATQIGPGEWPEPNPLPKLLNVKTLRQSVAFGDGLPDLITGLLSVRSKMMIAGPSKARKSWTLLDLAISISSGAPWLGLPCAQGKVIFIDGELHKEQILDRLMTVSESRLLPEDVWSDNLMIWPMRGQMREVTELMHALMDTLLKERPLAIILDPIYKLLGDRDENAAGEINSLLNELEQVARNVGCCILYSHHFAKGDSSEKSPIDRASGSGVWARDPDAMVFFTPPPRPKKGEAPSAYDFDVNLVARGHPPTDPFAVKWNVGHFERQGTGALYKLKRNDLALSKSPSLASAAILILREMPLLSEPAVMEYMKSTLDVSFDEVKKIWAEVKKPHHGSVVLNPDSGMWMGVANRPF